MNTAQQILDSRHNNRMWSITPSVMVFDAIKEMDKHGVGALLVLEEDRLAGIISERDYTRKIALKDKSSHSTKVSDIMTQDVFTVQKDETIDNCMRHMHDKGFRHLPIMDGEKVVGMLSIKDVLGAMLSEKDELINQLEHYISG